MRHTDDFSHNAPGLDARIRKITDGGETLDVGCGRGRYLSKLRNVTVIDAWPEYVMRSRAVGKIVGRIEDILPQLSDRSFDTVICIDVLEHLEKPAALEAIRHMCRLARRSVAIFTPDGFHPQDGSDFAEPALRSLQTHRSAWTAPELEAVGFTVERWTDFDYGKGEGFCGGLWAEWHR